jgi:N6-adenosine-specific RNA methylase IME4
VDTIADNLGEDVRQEILSRDFNASKKEVQKLAREEPEVQRSTIEIMKADGVGITEAKRRAKGAQIAKREAVLPSGKYRVLYADPPWSYGNTQPDYHPEQRDHYPVMSLEELCAMPIKDIAMDNAVLFLWVTSPILEESFQLIKAWGFQYKASFVWDKVKHNMGHYNSVRHEFLLICTRGSCQPDVRKLFDSVVSEERTEHSRKPELFYKIIETLYTSGPYLELFARYKRDGWAAYGNES